MTTVDGLVQVTDAALRYRLVELIDRILAATPDGFLMHGKQVNAGVRADRTDAVMWHYSNGYFTIQRSMYPSPAGAEYAIGKADDDGACTELFVNDRDGLRFRSAMEGATAAGFLGWFEMQGVPAEEFGPGDELQAEFPPDTPGIVVTMAGDR